MFNKKKNKQIEKETIGADIHQDLIVHNMPSSARLVGSNYAAPRPASLKTSNLTSVETKHNFKAVGLLIIVGGIIVISGLAYASYYFVIKPAANKNQTPIVTKETLKASSTPVKATSTAVDLATTTMLATTTPSILDLNLAATSSEATSSQPEFLPPVDSDGDGLYDEEELTLGLNLNLTDTDNDGYSDLAEINNNYNPAGGGKLAANSKLINYFDAQAGYEVLSPKDWLVKTLKDNYTTIFTAPDNSLIQISVQDNPDKQSILVWYDNSFPDTVVTYDKIRSTDNWDGIMGDDNLNFYLTDKKRTNIYVISYIPALEERLAFPNIFKLLINSFLFK